MKKLKFIFSFNKISQASLICFVLIYIFFSESFAQFNEYFPDYNWLTIRGKNVRVHYHEEAERTARVVLKIAEEVWDPITSLYRYEPDVVDFVIKDIDDFSNGATFFFDNKIEIWASSLDFDLRGTHNWLRNVISHEFTHLVQIQAGMKITRTLPAIYFQFLNYEDRRRPDILYGFPNFIASYPIPSINIPAWFAEGTAQYMRTEFDYDNWDTHRDMILRCYALEDKMLTWNQMGVFNKTSLGNESVYNSGFALTKYISQKYGEDKIRLINQKLGKLTNFTFDAAVEKILGKNGDELYYEWSTFLKQDYAKRIADVKLNHIAGELISKEGFGNFYPSYSDDGKKVVFISNKMNDYFTLSSIYLLDLETRKEKKIMSNVRSTVNFIPGSEKIVYSKLSDDNPKKTNIHDLYVYDLTNDKETRISIGWRANNPSVSNDGKKITFIFQKDGTVNLGTCDIDGKNFRKLTLFEKGEQLYNPKYSADGSQIYFDYSYHNNRDIAIVDTNGANFQFVTNLTADERNPFLDKYGNLYYASDESGIFNLYKMNLEDKSVIQLTNVIGGAFMPTVNNFGEISYAGYMADGYKIFQLSQNESIKVDNTKKYIWVGNPPLGSDKPNGDIEKFNISSLKNFDDLNLPDIKPEKYSGFFSSISFFPFIRFDNYNITSSGIDKIKPGIIIASSDVLNRYAIFGSAAFNKSLERDVYLSFEYRDKLPLLFNYGLKPEIGFEIYSISRNNKIEIDFGIDSTFTPPLIDYKVPVEVTYNLFEFDLFARHKIFNEFNKIETKFIYSNYTSTLGSFIIPESGNTLYPVTKDTYFIGRNFQVKYSHENILPTIDADINPIGRKFEFQYNYEFNRYNNENNYEIVDGILKPVYNDFNFHRIEFNWKEYFEIAKDNTLNFQFRAGSILGSTVPDFFDFYLGGLIGMKSYPFYSISGNKLFWANVTYRFPVLKNIDTKIGHIYVDKIYLSVYGDFGNAWNGVMPAIGDFKKGMGFEFRIKMNSFYIFPTSIFINAAYSFDEVTRKILNQNVSYGKEWSFYGGILFDFNF